MHAVEINCLLGCRWKRCPLFYFVSEVILLYFSLYNQCYYSRLCHVIRPLLFLITTGVFCISCQSDYVNGSDQEEIRTGNSQNLEIDHCM